VGRSSTVLRREGGVSEDEIEGRRKEMQKEEGEGSKTVKVERGRKSEKANVK
jgi:hypothetical protein